MDIKLEKINTVSILHLKDEINVDNAMVLKQYFEKLFKDGETKFVVNFEKVLFIDSSGLAVLISVMRMLKDVEGQLKICGLNRQVKGIFEVTKLHKILNIYETQAQALQDF